MKFKGQDFIKVVGDALTPKRFWSVTILTLGEYNQLGDSEKKNYRLIVENDLHLLNLHFGK